MPEHYRWNTGRQYDSRGQVMVAVEVTGTCLAFRDKSRGVEGVIHGTVIGRTLELGKREVQELVMTAYDWGLFVWARTDEEKAALEELKTEGRALADDPLGDHHGRNE